MRDLTLADLQQITTDTQIAVQTTTSNNLVTSAAAAKAHRKALRAIRAYERLRDQGKAEAAFVKFNSRAPQVLADVAKWKQQRSKGVITELQFDRDELIAWMEQHDITSRTGIERAIRRWYGEMFDVAVWCWFPFAIQPNWDLAMGQTGSLYVGFNTNADRISTRLKANAMLPF